MPAPTDSASRASRLDLLIGWGLGALVFAGLWATERSVGVPRDESFYFHAATDYAGWFRELWNTPGQALGDGPIARWFSYNSEHPPLMKELFGLSHALFTEGLHWLRPIAGFRFPAFVLAGIFSAVLYFFGARMKGRGAGAFAVLAFWLTPRHWYHGHLACFDFPIAAMWLFVVYGYWRGLSSRRWAWATGALFGLALATKHNAFFIPPVLALHWLIAHGIATWRRQGPKAFVKAIPHSFWAMASFGPAVLFVLWPPLWHHPVDRIAFWIGFHLQHVNYAWYYLGTLLREPPFPIAYPFVVTWLTVPAAIMLAMTTGLLSKVWLAVRGRLSSDDWLLVINGIFSIAIIASPSVPHFGGVKHWMPSMPFLCVLAGEVIVRASRLLASRLPVPCAPGIAAGALSALVLAPAAWGVRHTGGYGTSFYNELAGGSPGAAALGMQRQFWSNNVTGVFDWLNREAPPNARVFFHEVTYESYRAYVENGMLRPDIQMTGGLGDADIACYQYHQEFRFWEYRIWTELHTRWPVYGLYLDEVPNIECYQRGYAF